MNMHGVVVVKKIAIICACVYSGVCTYVCEQVHVCV